jgi:hypothetical protein
MDNSVEDDMKLLMSHIQKRGKFSHRLLVTKPTDGPIIKHPQPENVIRSIPQPINMDSVEDTEITNSANVIKHILSGWKQNKTITDILAIKTNQTINLDIEHSSGNRESYPRLDIATLQNLNQFYDQDIKRKACNKDEVHDSEPVSPGADYKLEPQSKKPKFKAEAHVNLFRKNIRDKKQLNSLSKQALSVQDKTQSEYRKQNDMKRIRKNVNSRRKNYQSQ